jgi:hypothetical protein
MQTHVAGAFADAFAVARRSPLRVGALAGVRIQLGHIEPRLANIWSRTCGAVGAELEDLVLLRKPISPPCGVPARIRSRIAVAT